MHIGVQFLIFICKELNRNHELLYKLIMLNTSLEANLLLVGNVNHFSCNIIIFLYRQLSWLLWPNVLQNTIKSRN